MQHNNAAQRVVETARSWIGTPYLHQASLKGAGCDCLGLVRGVWRDVEGDEPEQVPAYSSAWSEVSDRERLLDAGERHFHRLEPTKHRPGDVLVFKMRTRAVAKHMGICSAEGFFIHAYDGACVVESTLCEFWQSKLVAAFRFPSVHLEGR